VQQAGIAWIYDVNIVFIMTAMALVSQMSNSLHQSRERRMRDQSRVIAFERLGLHLS
jgi:hypothetical protein